MKHARTLINAVGADAIASAVDVDIRTVANKGTGQFPASWWLAVSALCAQRGVKCPVEAFSFKRDGSDSGAAA